MNVQGIQRDERREGEEGGGKEEKTRWMGFIKFHILDEAMKVSKGDEGCGMEDEEVLPLNEHRERKTGKPVADCAPSSS